jgi:cell division protein FtsQ
LRMGSRTVVLGGAAALVALLVWVFGFSGALGVRHVRITGNVAVSSSDVLAAAELQQGQPMLRVDTAAVQARVERIPMVASAQVELALPTTVRIKVTERVPVGYVSQGTGVRLVDKTGRQYASLDAPPPRLPRFDIPSENGTRSEGDLDAVGRAVTMVAAALPADVLSRLTAISATTESSIELKVIDGRTVRWGSTERNAEKAAVLTPLLAARNTLIDVSDPALVYSR